MSIFSFFARSSINSLNRSCCVFSMGGGSGTGCRVHRRRLTKIKKHLDHQYFSNQRIT